MAKQTISQLRDWFSRFKKPTEGQFWDLFDSFFHKDENIPASKVEGLGTIVQEQNEAIDSALTSSSAAIELANQAQVDVFIQAEQAEEDITDGFYTISSKKSYPLVADIPIEKFPGVTIDSANEYGNYYVTVSAVENEIDFSIELTEHIGDLATNIDKVIIAAGGSLAMSNDRRRDINKLLRKERSTISIEDNAILVKRDYTIAKRLTKSYYLANTAYYATAGENFPISYANVNYGINDFVYALNKTYTSIANVTGNTPYGGVLGNIRNSIFGFFPARTSTLSTTKYYDAFFGLYMGCYLESAWIEGTFLKIRFRKHENLESENRQLTYYDTDMSALPVLRIYFPKKA